MHLWQTMLCAVIQIGSELLEQEGTSLPEWQEQSAVQGPLFRQVCEWLEAFAGQPLLSDGEPKRQAQLAIVKRLRAELAEVLAELPPVQAMALLCRLPNARALGFASERLAAALSVTEAELQALERQAYAQIWELLRRQEGAEAVILSEPLPLLTFLAQQTETINGEDEQQEILHQSEQLAQSEESHQTAQALSWQDESDKRQERQAVLLQQAGLEATFDLRVYVSAVQELEIRQLLHRFGLPEREQVKTFLAKEDPFVVDLVAERMALEIKGKEEATDADA